MLARQNEPCYTCTMKANILYPNIVQMANHAESITWNRFYNFTMANSILVLAWATVYSGTTSVHRLSLSTVLCAMCLLGIVTGYLWAGHAVRGREFLTGYLNMGRLVEQSDKRGTEEDVRVNNDEPSKPEEWVVSGDTTAPLLNPYVWSLRLREKPMPGIPELWKEFVRTPRNQGWHCGSFFILTAVPLGFLLLNIAMLVASSLASKAPAFFLCASLVLLLVFIVYVKLTTRRGTDSQAAPEAANVAK